MTLEDAKRHSEEGLDFFLEETTGAGDTLEFAQWAASIETTQQTQAGRQVIAGVLAAALLRLKREEKAMAV